ncbi:MAG: ArsR family transcriptional regulator [Candidatus Hodarchaeota archaeon]
MKSESLAKLLSLVANPIRVEIIKFLDNEPRTFSEILTKLSLESTSKLSFHLEKLSALVTKNNKGLYELTSLGQKIYVLLLKFEHNEIHLANNNNGGTIVLKNASPSHIQLKFRNDFLMILGFTIVIGLMIVSLIIISPFLSLNLDLLTPLLLIITLIFPSIYLGYYMLLLKKNMASLRTIFFNSFSLLVFCIFTMSLAFTLLEIVFWGYQEPLAKLLAALLFNEFFYTEIVFIRPNLTMSFLIFIWMASYFFVFGIASFLVNHLPTKNEDQIDTPQLGKTFSNINQITVWIIIIPTFSVLSIISSNLKYNITTHYFDSPGSILPSTGQIFPSFTHLFPIIPAILILMAILFKYQLNYFSEISIDRILLCICLFGPIILFSVAILDSFMLISSAEMDDPTMIFKIITFIISKGLLGLAQFVSLIAYSLLVLNSLSTTINRT